MLSFYLCNIEDVMFLSFMVSIKSLYTGGSKMSERRRWDLIYFMLILIH